MNVVVSIERMNQEIDGEETESFVSPTGGLFKRKKGGYKNFDVVDNDNDNIC